ncbi:MAG: FliM/FliN family flagellar motor switch protein [Rhodobacteraceae bacterium]|mgnify:CR=1 FL=1|nr:FliM/FliN family flagellar motor switch protein [Paracoccaceae bacterium]
MPDDSTIHPENPPKIPDANQPSAISDLTRNPFSQVPIEITVSVGHARPLIRDLVGMGRDHVLALDRKIDDPVELYVGERMIARGILAELDDGEPGRLGVRLTEVAEPGKGL